MKGTLFHNASVAEAVRKIGHAGNVTYTPLGILENCITVSVITSCKGKMVILMTLEMLDAERGIASGKALGEYRLPDQQAAAEDARLAATLIKCSYRLAGVDCGWIDVAWDDFTGELRPPQTVLKG